MPKSDTATTRPLIEVSNLTRLYADTVAVKQVSFELQRGEVLGFLGPNGAGKSTTMQMITGCLAATAGEIHIDGHDLFDDPLAAKACIGYLPENPPVYRDLTVDEYLRYCARLHRIDKTRIATALDDAKQHCGLEDVGRRLIGNLSKGYQQRVGIAQAIIHEPAVVILDEPTVGLDPIQIREIRDLIKTLGQDRSVILSTHILPEVQAACDRVQIIRRGELIYNGAISELNARGDSNQLRVALHRPPSIDELAALAGVTDVSAIDSQRFRLSYAETDFAETLVTTAVEQNWGLFELVPQGSSLEEIFVELTTADEIPTEEQAA
jgi:ABC-2 type transport system ATP-binding protein